MTQAAWTSGAGKPERTTDVALGRFAPPGGAEIDLVLRLREYAGGFKTVEFQLGGDPVRMRVWAHEHGYLQTGSYDRSRDLFTAATEFPQEPLDEVTGAGGLCDLEWTTSLHSPHEVTAYKRVEHSCIDAYDRISIGSRKILVSIDLITGRGEWTYDAYVDNAP